MKRVVALALLLGSALSAKPAEAAWQKAESRHFVIYADDNPDHLAEFATRLEKFDAALRTVFGTDDSGAVASRRVTIFVLDDEGDVAHLYGRGGSDVAGFYDARSSGSVAFVPRDRKTDKWDLNGQQVLLHEYAHHFMFEHWSETPAPAWFIEGFAEFNATAVFDKDGTVTLGAVPLYRGWQLLNPTLPTRKMLQARVYDLQGNDRPTLYARGWLLTHYLITRPENMKLYVAYLEALNNGKTPIDAATAAFGDIGKLDQQLAAYTRQQLRGFVIPAEQLKIAPIHVEALSAGAEAIMPALIKTTRGVDDKNAGKVAEFARKLGAPYPDDPAVLNELAEAELDADNSEASLAAATKAASLDPQSIHARIYQGRAAMRLAASAKTTDPARWRQVRQYFIAANRIDPDNAEALQLYYSSFAASGTEPTKNAEDALLRAYEITPFDLGTRMTAAMVLLHRHDAAHARTVLATVAYNPHAGNLGKAASLIMDALDKDGPDAALALFSPATDDATKKDGAGPDKS